jgi:hypothetical protein
MESNIQQQLDVLKGQVFAAHFVLGTLCQVVAESSPDGLALVRSAFDRAADNAELAAMTFGTIANPKHIVEALRIVEEMRSAVLRERGRAPAAP